MDRKKMTSKITQLYIKFILGGNYIHHHKRIKVILMTVKYIGLLFTLLIHFNALQKRTTSCYELEYIN